MVDTVHFSLKLETLLQEYLIDTLRKQIPVINEIIMKDYDLMLNGIDTNKDSKVKPEYFEDDFRAMLGDLDDDFYINTNGSIGYFTFIVPDEDNLDLSEFTLLRWAFEGSPVRYVTATGSQFKKAATKVGSRVPLNPKARKDDMAYLVRYNSAQRKKMEQSLNTKLPPFVFSGMKGIDIFETANDYYENNIGNWSYEANEKATETLKGVYS